MADTPLNFRMENRPRRGRTSTDGGLTWQPGEMFDEWWVIEDSGKEYLALNHQMAALWTELERVRNAYPALVEALKAISHDARKYAPSAIGFSQEEFCRLNDIAVEALHSAGEEL